jgi:hypothetical protein
MGSAPSLWRRDEFALSHPYAWARALPEPEWLAFLAGEITIPDENAPPMPAPEFQMSWVGCSGLAALADGAVFLDYVRSRIPALHQQARILDFGCGWGRLYRILIRDTFSVVGVDSEPAVMQMCRDALPDGEFIYK